MRHPYLRWLLSLALLLALLLGVVLHSLATGELSWTPAQLWHIGTLPTDSTEALVLFQIRLPRLQLALFLGGALASSGVVLQGVFRNPLVEPYTLGISGGAALGVALAIVGQLGHLLGGLMLPAAGFVGALASMVAVYLWSTQQGRIQVSKMLLMGVMVSFFSSSAMLFLMAIARREELQNIVFWLMGSLDESNQLLIDTLQWAALVSLAAFLLMAPALNALRLGEDKARHLGVNTDLLIRVLFGLSSLLTGLGVATAGVVGFVGLIVPQLMRHLVGGDYRILLPASFVGGGILLILSDTLARSLLWPNELPVGVITGMLGAVVFIAVLHTRQRA